MSEQRSKKRIAVIIILAFVLPILVLLAVMAICGVIPFGSKSTLVWDSLLQHKDYYGYLWDVFHGKASIEYSAGKSLGGRMIGLIGFYISSPLNIFLVFFSKAHIPYFMVFMIILRIGLCGITGYIYIHNRFRISAKSSLVLSTLYALMEYNVYNCRNVMWLDGVIILPLIALGVWKCINEKRTGLLFGSVFMAILCNWYTGYMVCLMSGILFIVEYLNAYDYKIKDALKNDLRSIGRYVATMICGVLASMCILLPACVSLIGGKATNNTVGLSRIVNMDITQFLSGFDVSAKVNAQDAPLIFTGTIVLVAVIAFFVNKKVKRSEKICMFCLLALLCGSYCLRDMELVWTVFVRSTSYFFRFSFVFSFVMIMIAAREIQLYERGEVENKEIAGAMMTVAAGLAFLYYIKKINSPLRLVVLYLFILCIGALVIRCIRNSRLLINTVCWIAIGLTVLESVYNVYLAFSEYNNDVNAFTEYSLDAENVVDQLNADSGDTFYRYENNYNYLYGLGREIATGESLLYGYNSIEHYSSAYDFNVDRFLANMGYSDIPGEKYFLCETYWNSPMLLADSLLSIKYVQLKGAATGYEDTGIKTKNAEVYKNEYALPLGYPVSEDMRNLSFGRDPFKNQENLISAMTGKNTRVYNDVQTEYVHKDKKNNEVWKLSVANDGPVYVFVDGSDIHNSLYDHNCRIYANGEFVQNACHRFEINSMYLGDYKAGDEIELKIKRDTNKDKRHTIYAAQLDMAEFDNAVQQLKSGYTSNLNISGNKISGEVALDSDSEIFLSIPYEKTWSLTVDGKRADIEELADTFMGIKLSKGQHTIKMVYHTPGLRSGAVASVVGFVLYACMEVIRKRKYKKKKEIA